MADLLRDGGKNICRGNKDGCKSTARLSCCYQNQESRGRRRRTKREEEEDGGGCFWTVFFFFLSYFISFLACFLGEFSFLGMLNFSHMSKLQSKNLTTVETRKETEGSKI